MAENFSIEHSRTKITEVKKTIEDKKQKLDELKQQKKSLMDAGLALDSSNLDSAVQATLMESINDSLRDVENKAYDVSKDANQNLQSLEQIRQNVDDEITDSQMLCKFTLISISMKILVICIQPKLKTAVQYSQMK